MAMFGEVFGLSQHDVSVAATYLLAIVGFMILFRISQPMTHYRTGVFLICIVGIALTALFFGELLSMTGLSQKCLLLLLVFAVTTEPLLRYLTKLFEWIEEKTRKD